MKEAEGREGIEVVDEEASQRKKTKDGGKQNPHRNNHAKANIVERLKWQRRHAGASHTLAQPLKNIPSLSQSTRTVESGSGGDDRYTLLAKHLFKAVSNAYEQH